MSDDFDFEPIRGLPANLPEGERILWQGFPNTWAFAKQALHIRGMAMYFGLLMAWRFGVVLTDGGAVVDGVIAAAWTLPLAGVVLGLVLGYAYMVRRTTVYTVTSQQVVIRAGVAFSITATIPFSLIRSADLSVASDGSGTLALEIDPDKRASWAMLWPHVRPWNIANPQPAFRGVAEVGAVARTLSDALTAHAASTPRENDTKENSNSDGKLSTPHGEASTIVDTLRVDASRNETRPNGTGRNQGWTTQGPQGAVPTAG